MREAGVTSTRQVVVYDDWAGRAAARAWWLLRHHGHPWVRVLDGGWSAWQAIGGPTATGDEPPTRGDFEAHRPPEGMRTVGVEQVLDVDVLVDARAPERFRGEVEPVDPVAGHVPGAVNVPTDANLDATGRFLSAPVLQARYVAAGVVPGADVVAYCGSGVTATHDVLAMEVAGIKAGLYPGSWSEWVTDASRPVER
ncbi:sulfurtransferase [Nocardioides daphniae]|nr:rhodanese-like domain-containing protein [Nocardioides daphniae]